MSTVVTMDYDDSDIATGLPPLSETDPDDGLLLTSFATSDGIVAHPKGDEPVVFLSVRGLVLDSRSQAGVGWGQMHIGISRSMLNDLIGMLEVQV